MTISGSEMAFVDPRITTVGSRMPCGDPQMTISNPQMTNFDPFQSRFMYCFGYCHVKKGAKAIGVVRLIFVIVYLILSFMGKPLERFTVFINISIYTLIIIIVILLLIGINNESRSYMLPYIILEVSFLNYYSFKLCFILDTNYRDLYYPGDLLLHCCSKSRE